MGENKLKGDDFSVFFTKKFVSRKGNPLNMKKKHVFKQLCTSRRKQIYGVGLMFSQTDRQKAMYKSPLCFNTGGLNNAKSVYSHGILSSVVITSTMSTTILLAYDLACPQFFSCGSLKN